MAGCAYKGCDKPHHGRGLCKVHYTKEHQAHKRNRQCKHCHRWARHGSLCAQCHGLKTVELVPNDPFRERYLELCAKAVDRSVGSAVCWYMHKNGWRSYVKGEAARGNVEHANSGHLKRRLGLSKLSGSRKKGKVYEAGYKSVLPYDEAVALSRALGMAPFEAGV